MLFSRIVCQRQRPLIGCSRRRMITECGQQLSPGGMQEVIAAQPSGNLINFGQGGLGSAEMVERDGVVQPNHRRGVKAKQQVIEGQDLQPVGLIPRFGIGMAAGNRRLQVPGISAPFRANYACPDPLTET